MCAPVNGTGRTQGHPHRISRLEPAAGFRQITSPYYLTGDIITPDEVSDNVNSFPVYLTGRLFAKNRSALRKADLHAAILGESCGRIVRIQRLALAETRGHEAVGWDSVCRERAHHRHGTGRGQIPVARISPAGRHRLLVCVPVGVRRISTRRFLAKALRAYCSDPEATPRATPAVDRC